MGFSDTSPLFYQSSGFLNKAIISYPNKSSQFIGLSCSEQYEVGLGDKILTNISIYMKKNDTGTFLVVQWPRSVLPMQKAWV